MAALLADAESVQPVLVSLLCAAVGLIGVLIGVVVTLFMRKKNVLPEACDPIQSVDSGNPHNPDNVRSGDMAVRYWDFRFEALGKQIEDLTTAITTALAAGFKDMNERLDQLD